MICKNCGHKIFLVEVEDGSCLYIHSKSALPKTELNKKSWQDADLFCADDCNGIEQEYDIDGKIINILPICGCKKPEPTEKEQKEGEGVKQNE